MKDNEREFLAQVALGYFSVDQEGAVWRQAISVGGSKTGSPSYRKRTVPRRAETSVSRHHLKVLFTATSGGRMAIYAHRAVWMLANHAEIPDALEINHKDGNPQNNHPGNLEIATRQANTLHAARVLRRLGKKDQRGAKNTSAKLTPEKVIEIRNLCAEKALCQRRIAELYGVAQETVSNIHRRLTWKHL